MFITFNYLQDKTYYFKDQLFSFLITQQKKIIIIAALALSLIAAIFLFRKYFYKGSECDGNAQDKKNIKLPPPLQSEQTGPARTSQFEVNIRRIEIDATSSIAFNPNNGKYTYIFPAPPIKNVVISGGGAKGVILLGVIKAFEEYQVDSVPFKDQLDHVAGSSVGAITATLFSAGMGADDLIAATGNEDFIALLGKGYGPLFKDGKPLLTFIRTHLQRSITKHLSRLFKVEKLEDIQNLKELVENHLKEKEITLSHSEVELLLSELESLVETLKNKDADQVSITFSMLKALRKLNPNTFKDLIVTGTCRENGLTYYFDAIKTPKLDIALASRASASLPGIVKHIYIDPVHLLPGYVHDCPQSFSDGGYLDNVPLGAVEQKQSDNKIKNRGEHGQNLQTLALVFDDTGRKADEQSPFHDVLLKKPISNPSNHGQWLLRDVIAKRLGGINTKERNTVHKGKRIEEIRTKYTQRNIPLLVDLTVTDFGKAKKNQNQYIERGYKQGIEYLYNHDRESIYWSFDSLEELLEHLPEDYKRNHLEEILMLASHS